MRRVALSRQGRRFALFGSCKIERHKTCYMYVYMEAVITLAVDIDPLRWQLPLFSPSPSVVNYMYV